MLAPTQTTFYYSDHIWYFYRTDDNYKTWQDTYLFNGKEMDALIG